MIQRIPMSKTGNQKLRVELQHLERVERGVVVKAIEKIEYRGYVPPGSIVVPGTRPKEFPGGTVQLACAYIIGKRSEATDGKVSLNDELRDFGVSV